MRAKADMKVFIDLGAYDGDTIESARRTYADFERFYAFEPLGRNFEKLQRKFVDDDQVVLVHAAADTRDGVQTLYFGEEWGDLGGTLCPEKNNCYKDRSEVVQTIDMRRFIEQTFSESDEVVLKLDIEGKEYDVLERLMDTTAIGVIRKIYCEWHFDRVNIPRERHEALVHCLSTHGYYVIGQNIWDEFSQQPWLESRWTKVRFAIGKRKAWFKMMLKRRYPSVFFAAKRVKDYVKVS